MAQYPTKVAFRPCAEGSFSDESSNPRTADPIAAQLHRLFEEQLDKDISQIEVVLETGKGSTGQQ
jgi:hypothetical protein